MVGVEFVLDGDPHQPATELTSQILTACVARGLLVLGAGIYGNVIRFLAPLVITDDQLRRGMDILCEEIESAVQGTKTIQPVKH
jgi:4-aminobutyrate aminotransferase/(S)-3-amino-2-methylpropionate transaminase